MKLIIAVVRDIDDRSVINGLVNEGYRVTRVASTGGFLHRGNATLMIGVEEEKLDAVIELIRKVCGDPESGQHRATLFVVNASHFVQI